MENRKWRPEGWVNEYTEAQPGIAQLLSDVLELGAERMLTALKEDGQRSVKRGEKGFLVFIPDSEIQIRQPEIVKGPIYGGCMT